MSSSFQYDFDIYNQQAANEILPWLFERYLPQSIVDVGCGLGTWLSVANKLGVVDYLGLEGAEYDDAKCQIPPSHYQEVDLSTTVEIDQAFDLCLCLEVAEHLPADAADKLIAFLCKLSPVVLFSAAIPGQPGQQHIHCEWPEYWQQKFATNGFLAYDIIRPVFWNNSQVEWWYRQNIVLYARPGMLPDWVPASGTVHSLVHPDLYNLKECTINELQAIKEKTVFNPSLAFAVRSLAKALLVTPFRKGK